MAFGFVVQALTFEDLPERQELRQKELGGPGYF